MKEIGIFGGSFNPIHNGHIALAQYILQSFWMDEIWFLVSPQNPLKQQADLLDDNLRLEMTRKALQEKPGLIVSDAEFHMPIPSYTWNTLQWLSKEYPTVSFTLILGADNWEVFDRWAHHQDLIDTYRIIIYPRRESVVDTQLLPPHVTMLDMPLVDISSTEIRERVRDKLPIDHLVPSEILKDVEKYYANGQ